MGAYSTLMISETKAKLLMLEAMMGGKPSFAELEGFMDKYLEDRLYNCRIVHDDEPNNDDEI